MRSPEEGGRMVGGPFDGRIMAYDHHLMPAFDDTGKRIGSYVWDADHKCWEYLDERDVENE
jgi:hypothetical protein